MPVTPSQSATDFMNQLNGMAHGYTRDNTIASLVISDVTGELVISN